jgi:hypothetical protein
MRASTLQTRSKATANIRGRMDVFTGVSGKTVNSTGLESIQLSLAPRTTDSHRSKSVMACGLEGKDNAGSLHRRRLTCTSS